MPVVDPSFTRLTSASPQIDMLFVSRARDAKMYVIECSVGTLAQAIADELTKRQCKTLSYTDSDVLQQAGLTAALSKADIRGTAWADSTLDAVYDVDAGLTDVWRAVAETGSIVVKASPAHGRAVSLVPPIHFAVMRRSQIIPDLLDLMADAQREGVGSGIVIITGPSKTADIEMNLVIGVHGPGEVVLFLID